MAKAMATINLTVAPTRIGLWCDECLLPSKVEFGLYWIRQDGVSSMGSLIRCTEGHR